MNQINLGEVYYKAIRAIGLEKANEFLQNFQRLPIDIVLPDSEMIWNAAEIKVNYAVSYADCFVAATAIRFHAVVLTGDPEFKKLKSLITVEWV
jgi:ribonuclease VapC